MRLPLEHCSAFSGVLGLDGRKSFIVGKPSSRVKSPRIAEAPVAFERVLCETPETTSRHIFIRKVLMLHARDELIDLETWRVRLKHYVPVGRFGASDYVTMREWFEL